MELKQISTILNEVFSPNEMGLDNVTEDLSNVSDLGTALADMDENTLLSYNKKIAVGVLKNEFDSRAYDKESLGLIMTNEEYSGAIQRIKMELLDTVDTHSNALVSGTQYSRDLTYMGADFDSKVYTKDATFTIWYSIPMNQFKTYFTNASGVKSLIALIEQRARDTYLRELRMLEKRVLVAGAVKSATGNGNNIKLVDLYNSTHNNASRIEKKETALSSKEFLAWANGIIDEFSELVTDYGEKYNDGTMAVFTPEADVRMVMLKRFETAVKTVLYPNVFDKSSLILKEHKTVGAWQKSGEEKFPDYDTVSSMQFDGNTKVDGVVAVIYDRFGMGITTKLLDTRASYNGDGGFNNIYNDVCANYFVDTRNNCLVFTIEDATDEEVSA